MLLTNHSNSLKHEFETILYSLNEGHHEKWDGSGYPNQKVGEDFPISARTVAFADVLDALTSKRMYKEVWGMPINRKTLFNISLSCHPDEFNELCSLHYYTGINRVMHCGMMSSNYSDEPHDGIYALQRYVRVVNRRKHQ